jgi:hypothetical protein
MAADDLVAFITARLDEDERCARGAERNSVGAEWTAVDLQSGYDARMDEHIARHDPARVLREVAAKRRILAAAAEYSPELEHGDNGEWAFDLVVRELAAAWSDHPDYRAEWCQEMS